MDTRQLHRSAVLIKLTWHYWTGEIEDKAITQDTNLRVGVRGKRGRYTKQLFSEDFLQPMRTHTSLVKGYYYSRTLPWEDRGNRIISTKILEDTLRTINADIERYEHIIRVVAEGYPYHVDNQKSWLGTAWNLADYPTAEEFARKYGASLRVGGLSHNSDLRLNLAAETLELIKSGTEQETLERFEKAMEDCWNRIYSAVSRVQERLSADKPKIYDSLIGNIQELVDVLPGLNILDDPGLEAMRKELESKLIVDVEVLRADEGEREEVAARAQELREIMDRLGVGGAR